MVALLWRQKYFDGMETVHACGKPSCFVITTANPRWPEIVDALLPGQETTQGAQLRRRIQTTHNANAHLDAVLSAALAPGICI